MFRKNKIEFYEADDQYYIENETDTNPYPDQQEGKADKKRHTWVWIILIGYVLYLFIGILSTPYYTGLDGKKHTQVLNLEQRSSRNDFYKIKDLYIELKATINCIISVDKEENALTRSSQYSEILTSIDKSLIKVKSAEVDVKYDIIVQKIPEVYDSAAIYMQKMKKYISDDDQEAYNQALSWKESMFTGFNKLHSLICEFAENIKIEDEMFKDSTSVYFVSSDAELPEQTPKQNQSQKPSAQDILK